MKNFDHNLNPYEMVMPTQKSQQSGFDDYVNSYHILTENQSYITKLYESHQKTIGEIGFRGANVTTSGFISFEDNDVAANSVISGAAIVNKECDPDCFNSDVVPVCIANTVNEGFRYVGEFENKMIDLGPVVHPCLVGGYHSPDAILVPLKNEQAIIESYNMLKHVYNSIMEERAEKLSENNTLSSNRTNYEDEYDDTSTPSTRSFEIIK